MRTAIAGFVIGVMWLQHQASLPDSVFLLLIGAGVLLAGGMAVWQRLAKFGFALRLVAGICFGLLWASLLAMHALKDELPKEREGQDIRLIGTVSSLPNRVENGVRFNFAVEHAFDGDAEIADIPPKLALSWHGNYGHVPTQIVTVMPTVNPGERWQLTVRLKRPHGNANPYGFDYEAWLLEQGLRATGYVRPDAKLAHKNYRIDAFVMSPGNLVERARAWLRDRILAAVPGKPYAGVLAALVVGDQRAIGQSDWDIFRRTGISHLISISGLHITMIAGMAAALMGGLWRRSFFTRFSLPLMLPVQKAAALTGASVALLYVLLAGFGVPAQRTLYMLSVVAIALWFGRITRVSHVLCAALGVVLLLDPWAVLWPGFWLSFGAVSVILFVSVGRTSAGRVQRALPWGAVIENAGRTQYAVTLGLVPLTLLLFGQVSIIGPVANAIAIPLISLVVTPMALIGSVLPAPLSDWFLWLAHYFIEWLVALLRWMSTADFAVWSAPTPSIWIFALSLIGTLWMLAPRGWPVRWLGLVCWLPLILNAPTHPMEGNAWVTAFDVGQGSALLVETKNHRMLYDTGPVYSPESNGGSRVILPYLKGRGINALDMMVVTHNDNDHSGGALSILKTTLVGEVLSSLALDTAIVQAARSHRRCEAGQQWQWDGVGFEMMHPTAEIYENPKSKSNALSCVLKVSAGKQSILLTGDIGRPQEKLMIETMAERLRSTVMLVPHHGGATSSTRVFLETVKPEIALFQVGYRNPYKHPRADVYARYGSLGIERIRTDESGAITLRIGETLQVETFRRNQARYWLAH